MIIGITGKSGSGKTFLTKKLAESSDKFVYINMDYILAERFYKTFLGKDLKSLLQKTRIKYPVSVIGNIISGMFKKHRKLFNLYSKFFLKSVDSIIKNNPDKIYLIDSLHLPVIKALNDKCDLKILINTEQSIRLKRVLARKMESDKTFWIGESYNKYLGYDAQNYDLKVNNSYPTQQKEEDFIKRVNELVAEKQKPKHVCNCGGKCTVCHCQQEANSEQGKE